MVLRKTLENETVEELRARASKENVEGRSTMNREELIDAMASDAKAKDQQASDVDANDDKPREAQQNTNPDGSRKPTENELLSAVQGFKAEMLANGASPEDIDAAFKKGEAYEPPTVYEVAGGNHGHLTRYTTPSVEAVAGPAPDGSGDKGKDSGETAGGTSKVAINS